MKIKVSELVSGQVFRFPEKPQEYVVTYLYDGNINCVKLEDYDRTAPFKRGSCYFTLSSYYTVEIPPYTNQQLTLF